MEKEIININTYFQENLDYGIFIDDTGTQGIDPLILDNSKKSWVAVVIPPQEVSDVLKEMHQVLEVLKTLTNASEFHFSDIYNGKGEFKNCSTQLRFGIIYAFAEIFQKCKYPIIIQSFTKSNIEDLNQKLIELKGTNLKDLGKRIDLNKQENIGLLFLLVRLKQHIETKRINNLLKASIFIDEGVHKSGNILEFPSLKDVFRQGRVTFVNSKMLSPIQLADFAAFCLNRSQILLEKKELTESDLTFLEMFSKFSNNYSGIKFINIRRKIGDKNGKLIFTKP